MSVAPLRIVGRRPGDPTLLTIEFDGAVYAIRLRRHIQARRYTLRIHTVNREVVMTMPLRGSVRQARDFAQRHGGWIAARLGRLPVPVPLVHGARVPLRGVEHRIEHCPGRRGTVWTQCTPEGERLLCVAGQTAHVARRIVDFFKREARRDLLRASRRAASLLDVSIRKVSVRDQTSRWGSCSANGVLSYSWRLILAPPFVLDYLAAHEVAHLVEMNHSVRFWRVVERIYPAWKQAKAWLDAHGAELHRYGNGQAC